MTWCSVAARRVALSATPADLVHAQPARSFASDLVRCHSVAVAATDCRLLLPITRIPVAKPTLLRGISSGRGAGRRSGKHYRDVAQAKATAGASTIGRSAGVIRHTHQSAKHLLPIDTEVTKIVMHGIRRSIGTAPNKKAATADRITDMISGTAADIPGGQARPCLSPPGFAGAFRRSELVALTATDLIEVAGSLRAAIHYSKTDQERCRPGNCRPGRWQAAHGRGVQAWLSRAMAVLTRLACRPTRTARAPLPPAPSRPRPAPDGRHSHPLGPGHGHRPPQRARCPTAVGAQP